MHIDTKRSLGLIIAVSIALSACSAIDTERANKAASVILTQSANVTPGADASAGSTSSAKTTGTPAAANTTNTAPDVVVTATPSLFYTRCLVRQATAMRLEPDDGAIAVISLARTISFTVYGRTLDAAWVLGFKDERTFGWVSAANIACLTPIRELMPAEPNAILLTATAAVAVAQVVSATDSTPLVDTTPVSPVEPAGAAKTTTPLAPSAQTATDAPTGLPTMASTRASAPTRTPLRPLVKTATEVPTELPTEAPTEAPTGALTETTAATPTKTSLGTPTEASTQAPTESPTEVSTQAPTATPKAPIRPTQTAPETPAMDSTPVSEEQVITQVVTVVVRVTVTPRPTPKPLPPTATSTLVLTASPQSLGTATEATASATPILMTTREMACAVTPGTPVNFRRGPRRTDPLIATLRAGTPFTAQGRTEDGTWVWGIGPRNATGWLIASSLECASDVMRLPVVDR